MIYNPHYTNQTSNLSIDEARHMLADPALEGVSIGASWVKRARQDPGAEPVVKKLHHRPEYELFNLEQDPHELINEIDNPAYAATVAKLKTALHAKLAELGDADPIQTEKVNKESRRCRQRCGVHRVVILFRYAPGLI